VRLRRLRNTRLEGREVERFLSSEKAICVRHLDDRGRLVDSAAKIQARWAELLYQSIDGRTLKDSANVPQQHRWVSEGTRFLSGRDFLNSIILRINALPTRSRAARGRNATRVCRAGCDSIETQNHIQQICHRTNGTRISRHNAVTKYISKRMISKGYRVLNEPLVHTADGIRKLDLVAIKGGQCLVVDAQVVGEQVDLNAAHRNKTTYYSKYKEEIKALTNTSEVSFSSATLS